MSCLNKAVILIPKRLYYLIYYNNETPSNRHALPKKEHVAKKEIIVFM